MIGTDEYDDDGGIWPGVFMRSALENIEFPSTLKRIEYCAFENCKSLKSITLPDKLEYIGECCFSESALESVRLPPALKTIGSSAFD